MKKFLTAAVSCLAVVVLALTLAGCSKAGAIQKAYENAGYTVKVVKGEDSNELKSLLSEEDQKEISKYQVITATKVSLTDGGSATVMKFPSNAKIKEVLGDGEYDKANKAGQIKGDCYLLVYVGSNALEVFKKA